MSVSVTKNTKGETKETKTALTRMLVLPHAMRELVEKFATFEAVPAANATAVAATTQ